MYDDEDIDDCDQKDMAAVEEAIYQLGSRQIQFVLIINRVGSSPACIAGIDSNPEFVTTVDASILDLLHRGVPGLKINSDFTTLSPATN